MTFEQKVEKLRGINNKNIAILCKKEEDAGELLSLLNEATGEDDADSFWFGSDTCYTIEGCWDFHTLDFCKDEDYQIIPYSEFFADDEDKPLKDWTTGEVKEYYDKYCEGLACKHCKIKVICSDDIGEWDLSPIKPTLAPSAISLLKEIKSSYPNIDSINDLLKGYE